ncbi:MAG TPA: flagellar motor stator protein MotA [Bryobacteraceae bacterium]|nr:flagellar motor stator protein MotA [Bryobacteraceae bacterium]
MFTIIGILIVIGAIVGGYLMEHGNLAVLFQPAELVIIGGAALGTLFIANPMKTIAAIFKGLIGTLTGSRFSKAYYLEHLKMLNELFNHARKSGLMKLEEDVDAPEKSPIFSKYPKFLKDRRACNFFCDTLRMSISGGVSAFDVDQLMEIDLEVHHAESQEPISALNAVADSLPGLGIVAAVLGVIITMGSIAGPPEEVGQKVAAALVGTFLGILLCYGFLGPFAANMTKQNEAEAQYYGFLRTGISAYLKGAAPMLAVESSRRAIPHAVRPSFQDMEKACKVGPSAEAAAA